MIKIIFIRPKFLDNHPKLIFNQCHKFPNNITNLKFVFKEKKSCYLCTIINKVINHLTPEIFETLRDPTH